MGKPKIRFKGYTDDWEQRKLGDVIEKLTGGASITPDDYVDAGYRTIPKGAVNSSGVADMSGCKNVSEYFFKKNISSKTSSGELVTSLRDLVPTAPNMGRIVRICGETEDFLMPQGVYSIIVKEKISEDFLITYSNSPEYRKIIMAEKNGSTQVHMRNGEFLNIDIPLPSYEEQKKVGDYFRSLDHLITLHQRKCEETKKLKKYMLQKMFPQDGQVVPEIRFKGFTDAWEQRKLGDILERRIEQRQQSEEYPRLAFASGQGVIPLSERKTNNREQLTKDEFTKKYLVTELDDIVYNPANVKYGAIDRNKCGRGLISPIYVTFTTSEIPGFIERIVTSYDFQQRALRFEEGTVTKRQSVNPEDLVTLDVLLPHQREEQKKVGAYFDKLDHLITLHQNKCNELQNMKKFMLKNMFV